METLGIPNDAMKISNAIALVILGIAVQIWLYPGLEKLRIQFKPMARITAGLSFMTLGIAYGTAVQVMIYHAGPCYQYPTQCDASDNGLPNHVNVFVTLPMYVLIALAEIFGFVTGNEYAYKQAPKNMKSVMQSIYAFMTAIGSILGIVLSPLSQNPLLIVSWGVVTGIMFVVTCLFWAIFHKYDTKKLYQTRHRQSPYVIHSEIKRFPTPYSNSTLIPVKHLITILLSRFCT